ncbi:hypothetical protein [Hydrogenophaga sp.]|uniref:hypothetical protein n=1 Tax=Hydrogenophaga sp. TaxID=1904254 RepID=UPI0035654327
MMDFRLMRAALALVATTTVCAAALAQQSPWTLSTGSSAEPLGLPSALALPMGMASTAGSREDSSRHTMAAEWTRGTSAAWAAHLSVSLPPVASASGIGERNQNAWASNPDRYASVGFYGVHRFGSVGSIRPYAGAGLVYDGPLSSRQGFDNGRRSAWSVAMQAGFEVQRHEAWDLLLALKKSPLKVEDTGHRQLLRWSPTRVSLKLAPLRISAGTSLQF